MKGFHYNPFMEIKLMKAEFGFDADKIDEQILVIYITIGGGEKKEAKSLKDLRRRK